MTSCKNMAEKELCLACGKEAVKGARAPAMATSALLWGYLVRRCEEAGVEVDLDSLLGVSWVCRSCAKCYKSHLEKDERLYQATAPVLSQLVSFSFSITWLASS